MSKIEQRVVLLTKTLEDKDLQITTLINKLEIQDLGKSSHNPKFPYGFTSLSLDYKDGLSEISVVEMCIQGMHWGLLYILQVIKPH